MKTISDIVDKNVKLFYRLLNDAIKNTCPKCKGGSIKHIGSEWTGKTWIEIYECDNCKTWFI